MKNSIPKRFKNLLGQGQDIAPFAELCEGLLTTRECPPIVAIRKKGGKNRKLGDILPFVKGLRLSARLIYILRDKLKDFNVEINWGHIEDDKQRLCSPECDIIIHSGGVADRWNGRNHHSVMDFHFIKRDAVKAIISCKSLLDSIDGDFAKVVRKDFNIRNTFLFAEAVKEAKYKSLVIKAKAAGYRGLWQLYRIDSSGTSIKNHQDYLDFLYELRKVL